MVSSREMATTLVVALALATPLMSTPADIHQLRQLAAKNNVTCVLVFGDSSVDPGNNNVLPTTMKSNFRPYGKDFFNGVPTGRFSDGRLATDFMAEALGLTKAIPAFLDPKLRPADLLHGVSFASAASGYDEFTANLSNVLSMSKQLEYLKHYKIHLGRLVGPNKAQEIVRNAIFVLSMGTNDFLQNYYLDPTRPAHYTMEQYQNFLASRMFDYVKEMHRLGRRRLVVVGVPPLGCMPLVKMVYNAKTCVESMNKVAFSFNEKIKEKLIILGKTGGMKNTYVDCFRIIQNAVRTPERVGLAEAEKGCCGTGTIEYGDTCKGMSTCRDASKYAFWDAVHPSQKMYQIIADNGISPLVQDLLR